VSQVRTVQIGGFEVANDRKLAIIAGPCQLESRQHALEMSQALKEMTAKLGIGLVYKTSFDKANRSSVRTPRGLGMKKSLPIMAEVRETQGVPVLTDVHTAEQCKPVAEVVDVLQIPAFLCRQTDLLLAAGETGKPINVKKGQFLAPWDMKNVANKIASTGNENILLCERGVSFGYNTLVSDMRSLPVMAETGKVVNVKKGQFLAPWDMKNVAAKIVDSGNDNVLLTERGASFGYNTLVSDMRSLPIMAETGAPVIFDATHSVQQPGGQGTSSGGDRRYVPVLARAAVAVGVAGVFIETHQDPDNAPSDGPNMIQIDRLPALLETLIALDKVAKASPSA